MVGVKILLLASLMRPEREFLEHFLQASYIRSRYCRGVDKEPMEKVRSLRAVCSVGVFVYGGWTRRRNYQTWWLMNARPTHCVTPHQPSPLRPARKFPNEIVLKCFTCEQMYIKYCLSRFSSFIIICTAEFDIYICMVLHWLAHKTYSVRVIFSSSHSSNLIHEYLLPQRSKKQLMFCAVVNVFFFLHL